MTRRVPLFLVVAMLAGPATIAAAAESPAECRVAQHLVEGVSFPLPRVQKAIASKELSVLVLGAGSSLLPGASGAQNAYPARLRHALSQKLPGVTVKLTADAKVRRTAVDMLEVLPADLAADKPALVVWQTGTVDALRGLERDTFTNALEKGIQLAQDAGADVVLVNSQYSPRTESMIALGAYAESMRWVAVQREVPLFDRFSVMKLWSDLGTFDLYSATRKLDVAERVHDCIGRLLAGMVIEASKAAEAPPQGAR